MSLSDREVDSFNSKEELMEGRMNDMDNNQVNISVINFFLDSFYLSYHFFVWNSLYIIFVLFLDIWGNILLY